MGTTATLKRTETSGTVSASTRRKRSWGCREARCVKTASICPLGLEGSCQSAQKKATAGLPSVLICCCCWKGVWCGCVVQCGLVVERVCRLR